MNDIYIKNINALSLVDPSLAGHIQNLKRSGYQRQEDTGHILVQQGQKWLDLHGDDFPQRIDSAVVDLPRSKNFIVIMGMLTGELLLKTREKFPDSLIFVVEHDAQIFQLALKKNDFSELFSSQKICFAVGLTPQAASEKFMSFIIAGDHSNYLPQLHLFQDQKVAKLSLAYYSDISILIKETIDMYWFGVVGNDSNDVLLGLKHVFSNVKRINQMMSIEPYVNNFPDQVGVVVSSGPSLDAQMPLLKEIQDKAVIICADSALRKLLSHGIKPFGVSSVERTVQAIRLFEGFDIPDDVILFHTLQLNPKILDVFPGPQSVHFRNVFPFEYFPDLVPIRNVGLSCAHLSLLILLFMGMKRVALVGQDLAYARQTGLSHFEGIAGYAAEAEAKRERISIPDHVGGSIQSTEAWKRFRDFFTTIVRYNSQAKITNVIDKNSGALILGVDQQDPELFHQEMQNHQLEKSFVFECEIGSEYIQNRTKPFLDALKIKNKTVVRDLNVFISAIENLKCCVDFESFYQEKNQLVKALGDGAYQFYYYVCQPLFKRFDACGQGLWAKNEFLKHRNAHIDSLKTKLQEALDLIKEAG